MSGYLVKSRKLFGVIVILIAISILIFLLADTRRQEIDINPSFETVSITAQPSRASMKSVPAPTDHHASIEATVSNRLVFDDADWYEIQQWKESLGYFSDSYITVYESYDLETLAHLAQSGDIAALQTLAQYYLSERRKDIAKIAYLDAAARGSTYALTMAAQLHRMEYDDLESEGADGRAELIEAFALYQTAILRGDKEILSSHIKRFAKIYDANFSPGERTLIEKKAQAIYESLEEKRNAMGLDGFDNQTSDLISSYQTYMNQDYTSTK